MINGTNNTKSKQLQTYCKEQTNHEKNTKNTIRNNKKTPKKHYKNLSFFNNLRMVTCLYIYFWLAVLLAKYPIIHWMNFNETLEK